MYVARSGKEHEYRRGIVTYFYKKYFPNFGHCQNTIKMLFVHHNLYLRIATIPYAWIQ
jgi:hypothetical protein